MKNKTVFIIVVVFTFIMSLWVLNITKLANCDFEPDWKCEVIHGVGIIPPVSLVTVWYADDND